MIEELSFSLPRFQGPLDLLLSLVRKSQVSIAEIPIAEITRQYLEYMHRAVELDLDLGGEFTYIAATLILIKAQSLLPQDPSLMDSQADPRQQLIKRLLDYQKVRQNVAEFLEHKLKENAATLSHPPLEEYGDPTSQTEKPLPADSIECTGCAPPGQASSGGGKGPPYFKSRPRDGHGGGNAPMARGSHLCAA